ncbi:MAG: enoyl-CoA hydratase/isomerase family protein [Methanobacteriota archaeon]
MPVHLETKGAVAVVTIDRPEAANAIDAETNEALVAAWTRIRDEDAIRVAVLTGAGEKSFCAGADLKKMGEWYARVPPERRRETWDRMPGLGGITRNLDPGKPVIAAVNGHCLGGGLEVALACDFRIAAPHATFGLPEVKWGIIPGQGGTQRLARLVGPGLALELILTAEPIDAKRAQEIGLVNRIGPSPERLPAAIQLATTIASRPPRAVRHAREAVHRGLSLPLEEALRLEQSLAEPLRDSEDNREARQAFAEKREPRFAGR